MKDISFNMRLLLVSLLSLVQLNCGSETPFKRGENPPPSTVRPSRDVPPPPPKGLDRAFYEQKVLKGFETTCAKCHNGTRVKHVFNTFELASAYVVFESPKESKLYLAATGAEVGQNNHQAVAWSDEDPEESEKLKNLKAWIMGATLEVGRKPLDLELSETSSLIGEPLPLSWIFENNPNPNPLALGELNQPYFDSKLRGLIEDSCTMCHDNPAPDYSEAVKRVVFGKPEESSLYLAGSGQILPSGWKHKNVWRNAPENLEILKSWIMGAEL